MNFLQRLFKTKTAILSTLTVTSANGFHLRPIAKFVNEAKQYEATITLHAKGKEVTALQVPQVLALSLEKGDSFTLKCKGEEAQKANGELSAFFRQLMQDDRAKEMVIQEEKSGKLYEAEALNGLTISKGVEIGQLTSYYRETLNSSEPTLSLEDALVRTAQDLEELYAKNQEKEEAEIFLAHSSLLSSDIFQKNFENIEQEIEQLRGGKFESRMADYRDIQKRINSYMGKQTQFTLPDKETPCIVVADEELLPSEVEELSQLSNLVAVILQEGSPTSHASILLRSFKIPSIIINAEKITPTGEIFPSIVDASLGQFILLPTQRDLATAKERNKIHVEEQKRSHQRRFETTQTQSGKPIKVLANITDVTSAKEAKELGAEGVGLLRTEFLFTKEKPTVEEQTNAYRAIFKLFDEVTVRTLDIGGDKSLPYINIEKENNPFLGIRGIRFSLQEQTLFKEQLLAVGLASADVKSSTIKIMFPMVSTTEEFIKAKKIALEIYQEHNINTQNIQFGIMLEVPSVIFALKAFDKLVDFYSIGTNDLTQYLFAIERTHPTLSVEVDSPLLMKALQQIKEQSNKPISICGELAGVEEATKELIELGYESLSVSAKLIPQLKETIRQI